ncbi:epoxide hydrolase [Pseudonocardia ailaonensis]|uniref:Epoxide hydrolase n=1 Tax=Pseudonocardia ailaonensis TaxID=367279 RepID=A0ABN2MZK2_9PSEU
MGSDRFARSVFTLSSHDSASDSPARGTTPFRVAVPDSALADLRERLERCRWPAPETVPDESQGLPLALAKELHEYWLTEYDWRRCEAQINAYEQVLVPVTGGGDEPLDIHVLHARSPRPDAMPLLVTHGWPGSIVEYLDLLPQLTDPEDPSEIAFHVVLPTLPGFGFSGKPTRTGWGAERIVLAWSEIMRGLGYPRYAAHGGDWGSAVTESLGAALPDEVLGIHITLPLAKADPDTADLDEADRARTAATDLFRSNGRGYSVLQSSRPQTVGYALADSPMGQCSWIAEKFREWVDPTGDDWPLAKDRVLDNVMMYWLTNTAASSARLYWESAVSPPMEPVPVPTAISQYPKEMTRIPRAWIDRRFSDIRAWVEHPHGGHFAAMEHPDSLLADLRSFFGGLRPASERS